MPARRRFQLVLIKPSHYDDDGYVIRWWRAMIPFAPLYDFMKDLPSMGRRAGAVPSQALCRTDTRVEL